MARYSNSRWIVGWVLRIVVILALAAFFLWIAWTERTKIRDTIVAILDWVDGLGPWGPVLFMVIVALSMLALLPGMLFSMGAGFLFGPVLGTLYIVIGSTAGAIVAFLTGRYVFRDRVAILLKRQEKIQRLMDVVSAEGWRIVMLTRMVPMFPFKLSNYVFGLTTISLRPFVLGTAIGIVPLTATNVYAGSLVGSLATLGSDDAPQSPLQWIVYGIGFLIALGFVFYMTTLARKALAPYISEDA